MKKTRKHYTAQEKVAILRRHLVDKEPVSKLCDERALQPTVFYRWQKEFFENGAAAFQTSNRHSRQPEQERIERLEKKIQTKDEVLAELMAEHMALKKKVLGNSNQNLDAARRARPDRRFRAALVREDRDPRRAFHRLARHRAQQPDRCGLGPDSVVLFLARALRLRQRAQRLGSPGFLAPRVGKAGHPRLLSPASAARLPAADVHDARRRHRGRQPVERLAGVEPGGPAAQVEGQNVAERDGLPTASATASALAYRCFLHQHLGHGFYYLCSVLDGYSRSIVHWNLREAMREADVEIILEAAKEKYPRAKPRIISDNGPQFIAKDFKEFIRISGMTHVRTSPYYPQSNGKLERWHKSLKSECIRPGVPLTPEDARRLIERYVVHYNTVRLHSAIGFVTPADMLAGRREQLHAARDRKLEQAREQRQLRRRQAV